MNYLRSMETFLTKTPVYVILFVTAKCNARCIMCFNWENIQNANTRTDLTIPEIKKISKGFGRMEHLTLSGGEPSLREDLPEICRIFDKNNKVQFITFATNGLLPERVGRLVKEILLTCKHPYLKVCLSLDGLGDMYDEIRGGKGGAAKVLKTYNVLQKLKREVKDFEIQLNTTVSANNKHHIKQINQHVKEEMKEGLHNICLTRGDAMEGETKEVSIEEYKGVVNFMQEYINKKKKASYPFAMVIRSLKLVSRDIIINHLVTNKRTTPCKAGQRLVIINDVGDVFPCETLWDTDKMGNLRESNYDIKKIISTDRSKRIIKNINDKKCSCTFENAIQNSIIYSPSMYPQIMKKLYSLYRGK